MDLNCSAPPYLTSDQTSFAYVSARDRWPVILTGAIDDVHRAVGDCNDEAKRKEGKTIIEGLAKLKYELQHDRQLTPLVDDGQPDIEDYNQELQELGSPQWFSVPWLYSECYLYRRMSTLLAISTYWRSYDVFARQKMLTFRSSRPAVLELAAKYKAMISELESDGVSNKGKDKSEEAERLLFIEICEICLWGNATDLSLLTSLTYEDIQKLQGSDARKASEKNIIANDLSSAYLALKQVQREKCNRDRRVDIVLDNAGFELFVDLILAGYLIAAGLATNIVLHPKSIPWFVSDVMPSDFAALLNALADPQRFYSTPSDDEKHAGKAIVPLNEDEIAKLSFMFEHWSDLHREGQLVIRPNRFWTRAGGYWRLPKTEPKLFEDIKQSELVIFKGDLNYRKLTCDAMWDPTTPFKDAIGPMGVNSGVRTLALRTCKADTVVGLPKGEDERLKATAEGDINTGARKWAWSGKWAVIQFCNGK